MSAKPCNVTYNAFAHFSSFCRGQPKFFLLLLISQVQCKFVKLSIEKFFEYWALFLQIFEVCETCCLPDLKETFFFYSTRLLLGKKDTITANWNVEFPESTVT